MDIDDVFHRLISGAVGPAVKGGWVYQYVRSPISLWCDLNAPQDSKDPIPAFTQYLFDQGRDHESAVIKEFFPGARREFLRTEEEGFQRTLEMMAEGVPSIQNMPLVSAPDGLEGRPDVLERIDGVPSALGDYSYRVVEIKYARRIKQAHVLQAAAYNRLLGLAQGYEPEEFAVLNGDLQIILYEMMEWNGKLDRVLEDIRKILDGGSVAPCYGAAEWPWTSYVNQLAVLNNDVTLLTGVGAARRSIMVDSGFSRVEHVASAMESVLLEIKGIGSETAATLKTAAQSLVQNRVIRMAPTPEVLRGRTEVFFDFEGTDPQIGAEGPEVANYLIGAYWRPANGDAEFLPFFTPTSAGEESNLRAFLDWASSLEDPVFYHWHYYERTHLKKMCEIYDVDPDQVDWILDRLFDLSPPVTKSFAFPCYGRGLKDIAKALGFNWRQDDVDAAGSVVLFRRFVESGGADGESKHKILVYNEDDCRATMHVFDWLMCQGE